MPYADPEVQRDIQRAATRRRREAKRQAAVAPGIAVADHATDDIVTNDADDAHPPVAAVAADVTTADLYYAGKVLGRRKENNESLAEYHVAVQEAFARLLRVVG